MKRCLPGVVALAFPWIVASASAAEAPARIYTRTPNPTVAGLYDWNGAYVGANGGYASSRKCWDVVALSSTPIAAFREGCHDAVGATLGGQFGYRWQKSNWVFGLEAQLNIGDIKGSQVTAFPTALGGVPISVSNRSRVAGFGLYTGQAGYAWNNILWYVKGGYAATADYYEDFLTFKGALVDSAREIRGGATVGTGVEVAFSTDWSVAVEYDHLFMGTQDLTFRSRGGANFVTHRIRQDADILTARLNYRFPWPLIKY